MLNKKWLRKLLVLVSLLVILTVPLASTAAASRRPSRHEEVVGYFISWGVYERGYEVVDIVNSGSADKLTVINYAFANVEPVDGVDPESGIVCKLGDEWADYQRAYWDPSRTVEGEVIAWPRPLLGNFQQLKALKELYPNVKVMISLGGWTWSKWFSDAALTEESREAFVESCVDLFIEGNLPDPGWGGMGGPGSGAGVFDGIDVDWEYPAAEGHPHNIYRPEDTENFTLLLEEFREQLDDAAEELELEEDLLLTIAAPAGPAKYEKMELDEIHEYLDFINIMTYDFHGSWDTTTNFHSNLYTTRDDPTTPVKFSAASTVQAYRRAGVPSRKIVLGVPFYSRGWTGVTDENDGLYQPATGPAPGTWEAGTEDYKVLADRLAAGETTRYWSRRAKAAWLFDGSDFWTFDDPQTMCYKTAYVRHNGLRGVMFWDLTGDTADGELISAIDEGLSRPGKGWGHGHCKK